MRKILIISLVLFAVKVVFAQDIQVLDPSTSSPLDDTLVVTGDETHDYSVSLWVYNASTKSLDIKVEFDIIELAKDAYYAYCWDNCYGSVRSGHVSGSLTVNAGDTNKTSLRVDYDPKGYTGYSLFRLKVFSDSTQDTAIAYVAFDIKAGTLVIDPQTQIEIYPNPATSILFIRLAQGNEQTLQLFDILGNIVYEGKITGQLKTIDVSNLKPGVYILSIGQKDKHNMLRKIIITH